MSDDKPKPFYNPKLKIWKPEKGKVGKIRFLPSEGPEISTSPPVSPEALLKSSRETNYTHVALCGATKSLNDEHDPFPYLVWRQAVDKIVQKIQRNLSSDLLHKSLSGKIPTDAHPTWGHCYVATQALFHSLGGYNTDLEIYSGKDENGVTHWWLKDPKGNILDPTSEQYTSRGRTPPYHNGRRRGFGVPGNKPCGRTCLLLRKINMLPPDGYFMPITDTETGLPLPPIRVSIKKYKKLIDLKKDANAQN